MQSEVLVSERFEKYYVPEPNSGCFIWTGYLTIGGYGGFGKKRAHRVSYECVNGDIPDGLVIDHLCRTRCCVNPSHMEAVTNKENILRGIGPTARNAVKTHCKKGHEFTPENTILRNDGERRCQKCKIIATLNHRRLHVWAKDRGPKTSSSKYRGVHWRKNEEKWVAQLSMGRNKKMSLGYFLSEEDAALAYDNAAFAKHGPEAKLNFPERYADV